MSKGHMCTRAFAAFACFLLIAGCGGGSNNSQTTPPPVISVAVSPGSVTLSAGGTQAFAATVANDAANAGVTWSASAGSITAAGLYTAPTPVTATSATVTAASRTDPTKTASAAVTLTPVALTLTSATSVSLVGDGEHTATIAASITGDSAARGATFVVSGAGGAISASPVAGNSPTAVYTAPLVTSAGSATITVASVADPTKSQTVAVTLTLPPPSSMSFTTPPGALTAGIAGAPYPGATIAVAGAVGATTFTVIGGSLPPGLTLSASGVISGTPLGPLGTSSFTIQVTDQTGAASAISGSFSIAIAAPQLLSIFPSSVPTATTSTTITLTGVGFAPATTVYISGYAQPTTYISPQSVSFILGPESYTGTLSVAVHNSSYTSNTVTLAIVNPLPVLTSISPSTVIVGSAFTLTLNGSGFSTASTVMVNGTAYTIYNSTNTSAAISIPATQVAALSTQPVTVVNSVPGGGTSAALSLQVIGADNRLRTLNYPTADIVTDPVRTLLYASVTSPNSIVAIDPLQGVVVTTQTLSSAPGQLAITTDGSYLYVSLPSAQQVTRLLLPSLTPDITISLGYTPGDIEAAPGAPHTFAASGIPSGSTGSFAIWDDAVQRPLVPLASYPTPSYNTLAWGANASTLYATDAIMSGGPEYIFSVASNGPTLTSTIPEVFGNFVKRLTFNPTTGLLYDGYGNAANPSTGASAGTFNVQNTISYEPNPLAIDAAHAKAFFLNSEYVPLQTNSLGPDIQAFNLSTFSYINDIYVPGISGSKIVPWGSSGLAVGGGSQIYILDGAFVSSSGTTSPIGSWLTESPTLTSISPQTVQPGSADTTVTLTGQNFSAAAQVTWNNQAIPFTWVSSTQGTATIPAALLTQAATGPVYLSNGPQTETSTGPVFTVLPDLGPNTQIAALDISGQDMVWDPTRSLLYIAVTDTNVANANSIAVVDPATPALRNVVYTGNQPSALGISGDGVYLYAGFQTLTAVERFALSDFSLNLTIPLNSGTPSESFAGEVKVAPGQNQTIAVTMGNRSIEPRDAGGLFIFDNATPRPKSLPYSFADTFKVAWGSDATRLFAHTDPVAQPQIFSLITIDSTGVIGTSTATAGRGYYGLRPHYDAGTNLVYSDGGQVTNPANGTPAGVFLSNGLMVPDSTVNRAFFLSENANQSAGFYDLQIYALTTQTLIKTIPLGVVTGSPSQIVRWGTQGIAILTDGYGSGPGMLYILQGSDISGLATPPPGAITLSPAHVTAGAAAGITITVTGTNFLSTSTILVNGTPHATTFVSATQLSFQLTVSDQVSANYLAVAVTNPAGITSPTAALEVDNPVPVISSLGGAFVPVGTYGLNLTVSGSGLMPATVVEFSGSPRATTYLSPTQVSVALTPADLATAGRFAITAVNPAPGGGASAAATLEVDNPTPAISQLTPNIVATGSPARQVFVAGSNFVAATAIQVNGSARATTYQSSTQVDVQMTAADFAASGSISLVAVNPAPGGGTSNTASIAVNNGIPGPITLSPSAVIVGTSTPTTVTVNGSNLMPASVVQVNGTARTTTFVSSTQLTFVLTVADQATAGTLFVTVVNPSPGGGTASTTLTVAAAASTPVITALSPAQIVFGSGATTLLVSGTGFVASSVVNWNGTPLASSAYNAQNIYGQVPANLLASIGTATITVSSPTATPPLSNALSLSIVAPPVPTLTSISPSSGPIATAFTATLTGTGFTAASTALVNGTALPTTFVSSTQLTAAVPANQLLPGNASFTVTTPAPGGGTSAALVFTAYISIVNNSFIYNPTNGLFYLSVPSSAGPPYANSIVSLDPVTGALGTPIFVGSEPNRLALTSDGRYLWVGLDGADAVRKVDLVANTAGLQFSIPPVNYYGNYPVTAYALAALPGQTDSVIVSAGISQGPYSTLAIFDSGVTRGSPIISFNSGIMSLQVNGALSEIYTAATSFSNYNTYTYTASGLTPKVSVTAAGALVEYMEDRIQLVSGRIYTDYDTIYDSESGTLLGAFPITQTSGAAPAAIDSTLGLAFLLDTSVQYSQFPNQIQIFNLSNFTQAGTAVIPVNVALNTYNDPVAPLTRLTRWGADGLAFRNSVSVYSLRSNLVQNLSANSADLGVTLSASGSNLTGTQTTYLATVTNAGPSAASEVALTAQIPSTGVLVSAIPSSGSCSSATCDLGALSSGATITITFTVNQLTPGPAAFSVQVSASQPDPNPANNQATSSTTILGSSYNLAPTLLSVSPSAILAGSTDTVITLTGSNFTAGSTIQMDSVALPTSVVSATQLTATVPAASLSALGWHALAVSNPAPGGGLSATLPLSIFTVIKAGVNHILYEPFSRQIYATLPSTQPNGNSVEALTPATGIFSTPVYVGSEPTTMALSGDSAFLYLLATGSSQLVQYNLLTQQPVSSFQLSSNSMGFAVQTGNHNTLALTGASFGISIVDFATPAALRASASTGPSSLGVQFLDASDLIVGGAAGLQFSRYTVNSTGVTAAPSAYAPGDTGLFKLVNGLAYTANGSIANVTSEPGTLVGTFPYYGGTNTQAANTQAAVAPDPAIGLVFFLAGGATYSSNSLSGIAAFNSNTFVPASYVPLNLAEIETSTFTAVDVLRWGQDGLAALTSSGNIYLLRGGAVLPQLLQANPSPVLSSASPASLQHGAGNTVLTLTGSNFLPGVAVSWNGAYRTTNFVSATQITVDIPAADLAAPATASLTAANPNSTPSPTLPLPIN